MFLKIVLIFYLVHNLFIFSYTFFEGYDGHFHSAFFLNHFQQLKTYSIKKLQGTTWVHYLLFSLIFYIVNYLQIYSLYDVDGTKQLLFRLKYNRWR